MLMAAAGSRVGGLETIAREFAAALAARGHTVTLVTGVGPGARLHPDLRDGQAPYRVRTVPMLGQAIVARAAAGPAAGGPPIHCRGAHVLGRGPAASRGMAGVAEQPGHLGVL